jgi:hypothetical protein
MRTKTLLLTAALSAAGIATSMAQVFSVNAVGYATVTVPAGKYALVSNPLKAANNTINELFKGAPEGTQVYKYEVGGYKTATYDALDGNFGPNGALTVVPGEGVFVKAPASGAVTVTFVGEVMQGALSNPLRAGLQIVSSMVPQEETAAALGLQGEDGDQIHQYDVANQKYATSTFDSLDNAWGPALKKLTVGEAIFLDKKGPGRVWNRTFSVN